MKPDSELQTRCIEAVCKHGLNGSLSVAELAIYTNSNRLAVSSTMRVLEKQGRAQQWTHTNYGTENQPGYKMWTIDEAKKVKP